MMVNSVYFVKSYSFRWLFPKYYNFFTVTLKNVHLNLNLLILLLYSRKLCLWDVCVCGGVGGVGGGGRWGG